MQKIRKIMNSFFKYIEHYSQPLITPIWGHLYTLPYIGFLGRILFINYVKLVRPLNISLIYKISRNFHFIQRSTTNSPAICRSANALQIIFIQFSRNDIKGRQAESISECRTRLDFV